MGLAISTERATSILRILGSGEVVVVLLFLLKASHTPNTMPSRRTDVPFRFFEEIEYAPSRQCLGVSEQEIGLFRVSCRSHLPLVPADDGMMHAESHARIVVSWSHVRDEHGPRLSLVITRQAMAPIMRPVR